MKKLSIYFTTDTHGYIFPTNFHSLENQDMDLGMLKIANCISKDKDSLVIDGGDTLQGSTFTLYLSKYPNGSKLIAEVMNNLGYDYITLGNHDFNYGIPYLKNYIDHIDAKCICANISDEKQRLNILPYDIKVMDNGLKIGIVGLCTHHILKWEKQEHLQGLNISPVLGPAKKALEHIKDKVDICIGIYHGGFECDPYTGQKLSDSDENQAYLLASSLDFDILLTGHQHMDLEGCYIENTYCVQTGANAGKLCKVDIDFDNGIKNISSYFIHPTNCKAIEASTELKQMYDKVQKWLDEPLAELSQSLIPKPPLIRACRGTKIANFINQVQMSVSGADISACSLANEIKGFNKILSVRDIVTTYVYSNTLVVLKISGKVLKEYLEKTASYFKLEDGEVQVSDDFLKPKVQHYNYDYFYGIEYAIDLKRKAGKRIIKLEKNNKPIKDDDQFSIVVNSYRASGTGGYEMLSGLDQLADIQQDVADLLIQELQKNKFFEIDRHIPYVVLM